MTVNFGSCRSRFYGYLGNVGYDVFTEMLRQGAKVRILCVAGQWIDVDNREDLSQAQSP